MSIVDDQFRELQDKYRDATLKLNPDGSYAVTVPNVVLPAGWNRPCTTVYFVAPLGYPVARPDCFWTDPGLLIAGGAPPQNTGASQGAGLPGNLLWFSWHPQSWNPNGDSLLTYLRTIQNRFREIR